MDTSILNTIKQEFIFSISKREERIFFNNDQKNKKLHLLANPTELKALLEVMAQFKLTGTEFRWIMRFLNSQLDLLGVV